MGRWSVGSKAGVESVPDPPDPRQLRKRYATFVIVVMLAVAAFAGWLSVDVGTGFQRRLVSDCVFIVAPLAAAVSAWSAHRRRGGRHTGWWWIAAGCLTWAFGSVIWAVYELGLGDIAPFPSFADIGYVLYVVPITIGLFHFPNARGSVWSRLRAALDLTVMSCCLLLASAIWVLMPVVSATTAGFTRFDALAYPLADVTVATVVLSRSMVFARSRRLVWMTLSAGLLVEALTDSIYAARTFTGSYQPGHILDLGWLLSFSLVALAAQTPAHAERTEQPEPVRAGPEAPTLLQQLLPYGTIAIAAAAVLTRASLLIQHRQIFWMTIVVAAGVGVRQLVVVADHVSLTRDLHAAVQRRTAEIRHREHWWRDLVQNLTDVVIVVARDGTVEYCSPSVQAALGHWPKHLQTTDGLRSQIHPDDLPGVDASVVPVLVGRARRGSVEARVLTGDGTYCWFEINAVDRVRDRALEGGVLTLHDVNEQHRLTDQLSHQAHHDALTGLPNRVLLMHRLDDALSRDGEFSLLLIDLDDFKLINDSHGHGAGDAVLAAVGKRLTGAIRSADAVARLGGDEFALVVDGPPHRAETVVQRIKERLAKPVVVNGRRFHVSSSIGVVFADAADDDAQALFSYADIALYQAKAQDKGGVVLVATNQRGDVARQVHLREQIARPNLNQFSVVYQPIVDLQTGQVRGLEALLRWVHPEHGPISPADFIPLAEHGGSIGVLGRFVLETAVMQLGTWQRQLPSRRLALGVNVSILQLDEPDFAERVLHLISTQSLAPDQVVLEVTEQSLAKDFETAVSVVAELRRRGVSVAVDDYGTGYSSLRYLHRFDADVVKIDRSFIATMQGNTHTQTIVQSVIHMAEALDIQCIAEGIETIEQLELVRSLGCELGQGYLFARPLPPDQILSFVENPVTVAAVAGNAFEAAGAVAS